jgi:UDP-N-acetylmuramyl pentapeptide phosphotransferase/UDP-N-acetylglucosamine-1-phosphate transferase
LLIVTLGFGLIGFIDDLKKVIYKLVVLWAVIRSKYVIVPSNDTASDFKKVFPDWWKILEPYWIKL